MRSSIRLDVAVEHRAVGADAERVRRRGGRRSSPRPRASCRRSSRARPRLNTSAPPPGSVSSPASRKRDQHVVDRHLLDARDVRDLDGGERLDVHLRVARLEPAEHLRVVGEPAFMSRPPTMWNSRVSRDWPPSPPRRTPDPSCSGTRPPPWADARYEQKTHVFRRMQTLVGLMC